MSGERRENSMLPNSEMESGGHYLGSSAEMRPSAPSACAMGRIESNSTGPPEGGSGALCSCSSSCGCCEELSISS